LLRRSRSKLIPRKPLYEEDLGAFGHVHEVVGQGGKGVDGFAPFRFRQAGGFLGWISAQVLFFDARLPTLTFDRDS
jgi:hypothetical protein